MIKYLFYVFLITKAFRFANRIFEIFFRVTVTHKVCSLVVLMLQRFATYLCLTYYFQKLKIFLKKNNPDICDFP